jgi:cytidyltransferase-like protein
VIVTFGDLVRYRGQVAMVDGGFDPLHAGHIAYFRAAAALGVPVLCNVAGDAYVGTKHPPFLPGTDRAAIVDAIRYVDYTHLSTVSTLEVLAALRPRYYVKGDDWRGRLPAGEVALAAEVGIEVVFVPTVQDSSSRILDTFLARAAHGAMTADRVA